MQLEREAEGDEFADKEAFVTQAYKDQMVEVRKAEEEERRREGWSNSSVCHIPPTHVSQRLRRRRMAVPQQA